MKLVIGLFQFKNPLGAVAVEDELDVVMGFLEFFDRFERVNDAPEAFMFLRISSHHDFFQNLWGALQKADKLVGRIALMM